MEMNVYEGKKQGRGRVEAGHLSVDGWESQWLHIKGRAMACVAVISTFCADGFLALNDRIIF